MLTRIWRNLISITHIRNTCQRVLYIMINSACGILPALCPGISQLEIPAGQYSTGSPASNQFISVLITANSGPGPRTDNAKFIGGLQAEQ